MTNTEQDMTDNTDLAEQIDRRCTIENKLFAVAEGRHPPLTKEDCRVMAIRLGSPKNYWSDYIRNYKWGDK